MSRVGRHLMADVGIQASARARLEGGNKGSESVSRLLTAAVEEASELAHTTVCFDDVEVSLY